MTRSKRALIRRRGVGCEEVMVEGLWDWVPQQDQCHGAILDCSQVLVVADSSAGFDRGKRERVDEHCIIQGRGWMRE